MFHLLNALKAGQELKDPTLAKTNQVMINAVAMMLTAVANFARAMGWADVPDEMVYELAVILVVGLGLVNTYFTVASSKKVGL